MQSGQTEILEKCESGSREFVVTFVCVPVPRDKQGKLVFGDLRLVPEGIVDNTFSTNMRLNFVHIWSKDFWLGVGLCDRKDFVQITVQKESCGR